MVNYQLTLTSLHFPTRSSSTSGVPGFPISLSYLAEKGIFSSRNPELWPMILTDKFSYTGSRRTTKSSIYRSKVVCSKVVVRTDTHTTDRLLCAAIKWSAKTNATTTCDVRRRTMPAVNVRESPENQSPLGHQQRCSERFNQQRRRPRQDCSAAEAAHEEIPGEEWQRWRATSAWHTAERLKLVA